MANAHLVATSRHPPFIIIPKSSIVNVHENIRDKNDSENPTIHDKSNGKLNEIAVTFKNHIKKLQLNQTTNILKYPDKLKRKINNTTHPTNKQMMIPPTESIVVNNEQQHIKKKSK